MKYIQQHLITSMAVQSLRKYNQSNKNKQMKYIQQHLITSMAVCSHYVRICCTVLLIN